MTCSQAARARSANTPAARNTPATRLVFLAAGLVAAAWAPLVPFVQGRTGLHPGALGLLLLSLGGASIATMPTAGALVARFGCRAVILGATLPMGLALLVLAAAASPAVLAPALAILGTTFGAIDVAMNMQAIAVERAAGRAMMSGFHAFFSLGGILGAVAMTALLGAGLSPFTATLCIAAAIAAAAPGLFPFATGRGSAAFAVPHGTVLFLGALCFIAFLSEGAVLDWGAVFLTTQRGLDTGYGGLGYAIFSAIMTLGRFLGDRLVQRAGGKRVMLCSGLCAAAGFGIAAALPSWPAALAGYALVGAGCSNIVPVLFTRVGRQATMPEHAAVAAMTTLGYAGILAGPAAIGAIAQFAGLPAAFVVLAALQLPIALAGRLLKT
ncbi:MAG TPA: MFS transporter [Rhodopila sp.]|nr:MFS transporter [Rhodopila sp.]